MIGGGLSQGGDISLPLYDTLALKYWCYIRPVYLGSDVCASRVAQWKRAGPITQRSMD